MVQQGGSSPKKVSSLVVTALKNVDIAEGKIEKLSVLWSNTTTDYAFKWPCYVAARKVCHVHYCIESKQKFIIASMLLYKRYRAQLKLETGGLRY